MTGDFDDMMLPEELLNAAVTYGTPAYLFDTDLLASRTGAIRERLTPPIALCYAMKANPVLTPVMAGLTDRIEVCSPGEMRICISQHIEPGKILMSGVNKYRADIDEAISYGVALYTAESLHQLDLLREAASAHQRKMNVFLRLCAGSQFGMDPSLICSILKDADYRHDPWIRITGIHYFTGTQRRQLKMQEKDLEKLTQFLSRLERECDYVPEEIEYGPGLYVPYFEGDEEDDLQSAAALNELLCRELTGRYRVTVEMGRYFAAPCGYYLTKVCDKKENDGHRYLILDGGIHQLNYYGGMMGLKVPRVLHLKPGQGGPQTEEDPTGEKQTEEKQTEEKQTAADWCLCGSLCTTADVLVRALPVISPEPGDVFAFRNTGAYSLTESNALFLCREMPQILLRRGGVVSRIRDKIETSTLFC